MAALFLVVLSVANQAWVTITKKTAVALKGFPGINAISYTLFSIFAREIFSFFYTTFWHFQQDLKTLSVSNYLYLQQVWQEQ